MLSSLILTLPALWSIAQTHAEETAPTTLEAIVVNGQAITGADDQIGVAESAAQGKVGAQELENRPVARPGEVLESVPGMVITQHAGGGKANQYYLRGFNLDHGTDFAGYLNGVPLNLPTHAHGQGYMDLNWLIPELVQGLTFEKGVYYADQGDFANAGSAEIQYYTLLPHGIAQAEVGGLGYSRALLADSPQLGAGHLLYALEWQHFDGAWQVPMNYRRYNGVLRYSEGDEKRGWDISAQAYSGEWLGSEQIPERAIESGLVDRFGSLDPSTGGETERYSLSASWHRQTDDSSSQVTVYLAQYDLDLYSDFTYALNQVSGDEINQRDARVYAGARASHTFYGKLLGRDSDNTLGLGIRQDWVTTRLDHDQDRILTEHVRTDHSSILNVGPYYENHTQWTSWFRSIAGVRADLFTFRVDSDTPINSGSTSAGAVSPKLSLVFSPWGQSDKTEFYLNGGLGFRSNDARGILSSVDPANGSSTRQLPALVKTRGAEMGVRTHAVEGLISTASLWSLWSDSDTFFDGDAGATVDADRPGVRYGVEWTNAYSPLSWLSFDVDLAYSKAQFTDDDPLSVGKLIPESVTSVISAGASMREIPGLRGIFGSLRLRQFGPRPLIEDGSQKSMPSVVLNLLTGYEFNKTWSATVAVLNLLDEHYNDNEYYYSSRLKGEPAGPDDGGGYNDHMVHAGEPRNLRASVTARF